MVLSLLPGIARSLIDFNCNCWHLSTRAHTVIHPKLAHCAARTRTHTITPHPTNSMHRQ